MDILQKFCSLFGAQYVLLRCGRRTCVRRAYTLAGDIYADPYLSNTRVVLLPGGRVEGNTYVVWWKPITAKTVALYNRVD